jgi:hypothetical protein
MCVASQLELVTLYQVGELGRLWDAAASTDLQFNLVRIGCLRRPPGRTQAYKVASISSKYIFPPSTEFRSVVLWL